MNRKLYITEAQLKNLLRNSILNEDQINNYEEQSSKMSDEKALKIINILENLDFNNYEWGENEGVYDYYIPKRSDDWIKNLTISFKIDGEEFFIYFNDIYFSYKYIEGSPGNYWTPPTDNEVEEIKLDDEINEIDDLQVSDDDGDYVLSENDFGEYGQKIKEILNNKISNYNLLAAGVGRSNLYTILEEYIYGLF